MTTMMNHTVSQAATMHGNELNFISFINIYNWSYMRVNEWLLSYIFTLKDFRAPDVNRIHNLLITFQTL